MKQQCDNCGELKELSYVFEHHSENDEFMLEFCDECGKAILRVLKAGVYMESKRFD